MVDLRKLLGNLQNDGELVLSALEAFTQAMVRAIPSGKQNTFAAHNLPAFVGICLRHAGPLNLANAFEKPVVARADASLSERSVAELARHDQQLASVYGDSRDRWAYLDISGAWPKERGEPAGNLQQLADWLRSQVSSRLGG